MRWATAGLGLLIAGLLTFMGIYFVLDGTIVNEENYHGLKEAMEGAMYDAIDLDYYYKTGEIKIIKEKFVENFTRRFNNSTLYGKEGYVLKFYDIIESPPKASIVIEGSSGKFRLSIDSDELSSYDIINRLDAILKYNGKHLYTYELYSLSSSEIFKTHDGPVGIWSANIRLPDELKTTYGIENEKNNNICKIVNIEYVSAITQSEYPTIKETYLRDAARKPDLNSGVSKWYYFSDMISAPNIQKIQNSNQSTFCEIETVECFEFTKNNEEAKGKECAKNACTNKGSYEDCLHDLIVTYKDSSCKNKLKDTSSNYVTGYKYRVTWECSQ